MINAVIGGYRITEEYCGGFAEGSVALTELNRDAFLTEEYYEMAAALKAKIAEDGIDGYVFNTEYFTVNGQALKSYKADVHSDANYAKDTEVIKSIGSGENAVYYFQESEFRSAPYFDIVIDGIKVPAN